MSGSYRSLPSVDRLLAAEPVQDLLKTYSREAVLSLVREQLDEVRSAIAQGKPCPPFEDIIQGTCRQAELRWSLRLQPFINATGIILHTNLGRAPLSAEAIAAIDDVASSYSNLEFDLDSGSRGSRHHHVEDLLCQVTGAEAGLAVNNNASALLLGLSALAKDKEVIISRGQAVEIGGGFRIPDVMRQSGARLVEVGTTNRTYISDYEQAITAETAAIMRVHSSNFRVVGFTESVALEAMVELAARHNLLVLDDLGSGCLLDTTRYGLEAEPTVQDSARAGADLAFFSGDKLLGGPQAGIIVGKKVLVDKLKRHPLARAVRMDKLCLAALGATLLHYLRGEAEVKVPVWRMIAAPVSEMEERAGRWAAVIPGKAGVCDGLSMIGGGSLPGECLPTRLLSITPPGSAQSLAEALRRQRPPIVARIEKEAVLLDPRTVLPEQDTLLEKGLASALGSL